MWKRIKRAVNSNLGRFSGDPLSSDAPRRTDLDDLGESLEVVKKQVSLLEKDLGGLQAEETALTAKIRAALDSGDRDGAKAHAGVLARVRDSRQRVKIQLDAARSLCNRAEGVSRDLYAPELDSAADETLARIEAGLQTEGKLPSGRREESDQGPSRKTLGDESGPSAGGKTIAEAAARPGKSIGGAPDYEEPAAQKRAAKTIGGPPESKAAEPKAAKTLGEAKAEPAAARNVGPEAPKEEGSRDLVAELERLARLLDKGILSKDEFDQAKKKLLG